MESLGRASLSYEEFITIICDCEQIVNARPITYVSEDMNDLTPLKQLIFLREIRSSDVIEFRITDTQELNRRV